MARKPTTRRIKNKQIQRNRENGLIPKCYKYGKLDGVELFLAINYTEKNEFHTYSSKGDLPWLERILQMMKQPNATNILPQDWERRRNRDETKDPVKEAKVEKTVEGLVPVDAIPPPKWRGLVIPDLPSLDLTILRKQRAASPLQS